MFSVTSRSRNVSGSSVNERDACSEGLPRVSKPHHLPVHLDCAEAHAVHAGDGLCKARLPGAVLSYEGMDFS